jgi:undecaprenyl-diphosphatase
VTDYVQAAILGLIQGLTEFLPISSTAHLTLVPWLLGWQSPLLTSLTFDLALHMGTLAVVLVYFRHDWLALAAGLTTGVRRRSLNDRRTRLALSIVVGTIPAVIAGVLAESWVESAFRSELLIAAVLVLASVVFVLAERAALQVRNAEQMSAFHALLIGCGQAIAIVPGVSRSGATIATGLLVGLDRASAARFSFLLSTPIVAAAGAKRLLDAAKSGAIGSGDLGLMIVGATVAAITGWFCIRWLLSFLARDTLIAFVWYRVGFAALIVAVYLVRGA